MINRENLIKIGRAGGNTSNRETPDQIGRVGISDIGTIFSATNLVVKELTIFTCKVGFDSFYYIALVVFIISYY